MIMLLLIWLSVLIVVRVTRYVVPFVVISSISLFPGVKVPSVWWIVLLGRMVPRSDVTTVLVLPCRARPTK